MLKRRHHKQSAGGFTMIEMIAVLVLVGLLVALAGTGLTAAVQGYLMARESTAMAQKAQLALTRLSNEFLVCYDCIPEGEDANNGLPFTYDNVLADDRVVALDGDTITVNGTPLVDRVSAFTLDYDNLGRVVISFSLDHRQAGSSLDFTTTVLPRNSYQ